MINNQYKSEIVGDFLQVKETLTNKIIGIWDGKNWIKPIPPVTENGKIDPLTRQAINEVVRESTQEPMEWGDRYYDEWKKVKQEWWSFSMKKNNNNYDPAIAEIEEWFYYRTSDVVKDLIKQAEERVLNELREVVKDDEDGSDTLEEIISIRKILN